MLYSDYSYWGGTTLTTYDTKDYTSVADVAQNVEETYEEVKTTVSNTVDTAKKVVTVGGVVLIAALAWNFFGKDIYKFSKGTL